MTTTDDGGAAESGSGRPDLGPGLTWRDGRVEHGPEPEAELAAAEGGAPLLVPLATTSYLRVAGDDRLSFLHGQLSHEVQGVAPGGQRHALQLDARGQVVAEASLLVRPDDVLLAVDDDLGGALAASLERHIVFDQVTVEDASADRVALTLQGRGAAERLARLGAQVPAADHFVETPLGGVAVLVVPRRRGAHGGFDLHVPRRAAADIVRALTAGPDAPARLAGEAALRLGRVLAGAASAAYEAPGALPQETGLGAAVSYRKGCYLGQEIMARIEARGSVKRSLATLRLTPREDGLDDPRPASGAAVTAGDAVVGRVGTVARDARGGVLALAVVRRALPEGVPLAVGAWGAAVHVRHETEDRERDARPAAATSSGAAGGTGSGGTGAGGVEPSGAG